MFFSCFVFFRAILFRFFVVIFFTFRWFWLLLVCMFCRSFLHNPFIYKFSHILYYFFFAVRLFSIFFMAFSIVPHRHHPYTFRASGAVNLIVSIRMSSFYFYTFYLPEHSFALSLLIAGAALALPFYNKMHYTIHITLFLHFFSSLCCTRKRKLDLKFVSFNTFLFSRCRMLLPLHDTQNKAKHTL